MIKCLYKKKIFGMIQSLWETVWQFLKKELSIYLPNDAAFTPRY